MRAEAIAALRAAGCVFAEDEADLLIAAADGPERLADMVARRVDGLPLEHIVGFAEFCGRRIAVEPGVFVPRRRTELLVEEAARFLRPETVAGIVADAVTTPRDAHIHEVIVRPSR